MADERVSRVYAAAIFESARAAGKLKEVEAELSTLRELLSTHHEFRTFITSPKRSRAEKANLIDSVFGAKVSDLTGGLIKVMLEKRREAELESIHGDFVTLRRESEKVVHAHITSAFELTAEEQKKISSAIGKKLGKTVETSFAVDATLVGGVRVAYDEFVMDGSVRGSLNRLTESLRYDALKQA